MARRKHEETQIQKNEDDNEIIGDRPLSEAVAEEPYTIIFTDGDTIDMPIEALCDSLFLVPFYDGRITITYDGKRITHMSREQGIFRLVLEDESRSAVISGQMLTVKNTAAEKAAADALYDAATEFLAQPLNQVDAEGDIVKADAIIPDEPTDGEAAG